MAFASVTYTSASGTTFALTNNDGNAIEYLRQSDISVTVNGTLQTLTTDYTFNAAGTSIVLNSAVSGATVVLARTTSITDATVSFTAGSTLTAQDLNNSDRQNRFALQEFSDVYDSLRTGTGDLSTLGGFIGSSETWVADNAHAATTGAIDVRVDSKIDTALTTDVVAGNAITITDNSPSSGQITVAVTDGAIDTAELANNAVTTAKITDSNVTTAKINDAAVTTAKIADAAVTTAKLANDSVTSAKIADGTIIAGDIANNAVTTAKILDANVTTAKIADSNVTTAKINDAAVTEAKIAGSAVTSGKIASGSIDSTKLTGATVVTNAEHSGSTPNDTSFFTTSASDARYFRQDSSETIDSGDTWSGSDSFIATTAAIDARIIDLVDDVGGFVPIANETSFPATNPDINNPDGTGTIISVAEIATSRTPSSGTVTIANGSGSNTVTINGCGTTVLAAGFGVLVETTSTLHTYTFHRLVPKATEVTTVASISGNITTVANNVADVTTVANDLNEPTSEIETVANSIANVDAVGGSIANVNSVANNLGTVNDFAARYRVASSDPTTSLDTGDLVFNTTSSELRVYNGSAWQGGVTATGNLLSKSGDTMTGALGVVAGTAGAPSVFISGDTNTGIYSPGADQIAVATNGAGRLLVDDNGLRVDAQNVTILDQSPAVFVDGNADDGRSSVVLRDDAGPGSSLTFIHSNYVGGTELNVGGDGTVLNGQANIAFNAGASSDIRFGVNDVETVRIDSNGRVGVGVSPTWKLDVSNTASTLARFTRSTAGDAFVRISSHTGGTVGLQLGDDGDIDKQQIRADNTNNALIFNTANSERLRIDSSGRLLVGTPTSVSQNIANGTITPQLQNAGTNQSGAAISSVNYNSGGSPAVLALGSSTGGTLATQGVVNNNGKLGRIAFTGSDGTTLLTAAEIIAEVNGTPGANDMPGRLVFSTTSDGASSPTERMRIDASGNITLPSGGILGINGAAPQSPLDVISNASGYGISLRGRSADNSSQLRFVANNHGSVYAALESAPTYLAAQVNGTERLRIDANGRLLVGTSSAIAAGSVTPVLEVVSPGSTGATGTTAAVMAFNTAASDPVRLVLAKSLSSTQGGHVALTSGADIGSIRFMGSDGTQFQNGAIILSEADGTWASGDCPTRLMFSTTAAGTAAPTERMRIANTGAFGLSGANYGTSGQVLTSQGSGSAPQWATVASPAIVQRVVKEYSTSSTFTSPYIPFDNTIPQTSETHLIITQAFTPVSTTNKLFIAAQIGMVDLSNAGNPIIVGIFDNQSGSASARAVAMTIPNPAGYANPLRCEYEMGGTLPSSITFYVRVGITNGTLGINRRTDAQYFGGTVRSYLVIDEVRV